MACLLVESVAKGLTCGRELTLPCIIVLGKSCGQVTNQLLLGQPIGEPLGEGGGGVVHTMFRGRLHGTA